MNLQSIVVKPPVRVLMINSFITASKLLAFKILGGSVFGRLQQINIILLVYENEVAEGEILKSEIESCAFSRCNSVEVTSNLPSYSDADVFCIATNFPNPHFLDFTQALTDLQFDSFYLLLKVAHNFSLHPPPLKQLEDELVKKGTKLETGKKMRPIFFTDGLVSLDILNSFSKVVPPDTMFCPTSLPPIAKTILGDHLKVTCDKINDVRVWAASAKVFHVEINKPIVRHDPVIRHGPRCIWDMMGPDMMDELNLDHTQFNDAWVKKEFLQKIKSVASENVYGPIYKSHSKALTIRAIWKPKRDNTIGYHNLGIISDGSMGTLKGIPYVMPALLSGDSVKVNEYPQDYNNCYIKANIKAMNNLLYEHHNKLMIYCKKFLQSNVIDQEFVPGDDTVSYTTPLTTNQPCSFSSDTTTSGSDF